MVMARENLRREIDKHLPRVTVTNDLDLNALSQDSLENILNEVLVHPAFHFAHPTRHKNH